MLKIVLEQLKRALFEFNLAYCEIEKEESLLKIRDLWCHDILTEPDVSEAIELFYYGSYYYNKDKNYELVKKYYLLAAELGYLPSMCNLASYYIDEKNYTEIVKVLSPAVKVKFPNALNLMGYYHFIEENYDLMKKYYGEAIELKHGMAMQNLGNYYQFVEKNYDLMKKYYLMGIKSGNSNSIDALFHYYSSHNSNNKDLSFIQIGIEYSITEHFLSLFNSNANIIIPPELYSYFCQWKLKGSWEAKQNILKTTGVFPTNYTDKFQTEYTELVAMSKCSAKYILPKDMLLLIAGHLYL